ncbi:hypothetical protein ACLK1T_13780 [Escherichia coli]
MSELRLCQRRAPLCVQRGVIGSGRVASWLRAAALSPAAISLPSAKMASALAGSRVRTF